MKTLWNGEMLFIFITYCFLFIINCLLFIIYCLLFIIYCVLFVVYFLNELRYVCYVAELGNVFADICTHLFEIYYD